MGSLKIDGIELTQAIQFFRSQFALCGSPSGMVPCGDNSLPLVEGKDTVLRVYVTGATSGATHKINGILTTPAAILTALPIDPPPSPIDRTQVTQTINFVLPAAQAIGAITVNVGVWDSDPSGGYDGRNVNLIFAKSQPVPVRMVYINYRGRGLNLAAPTQADFFNAVDGFLARTYPAPWPGVKIVQDSVEIYDGDFSSTISVGGFQPLDGTTGTVWAILENLITAEGLPSDVLYGAVIPPGSLPANATIGAVFPVGYKDRRFFVMQAEPDLTATVIAHILWEVVSPCLVPTAADAQYSPPSLSGLPSNSIGEVGMDIETQQAMDPKLPDLLSPTATSPRWISPYTYQGLARRLICPGSTIQTPPAQFNLPQLNLGIVMDRPDIYTIVNLPTWIIPSFPPPLNVAGPQFVELRSADGAVLSRQGIGLWSMPLADGGARYARVSLPWADSAASLVLVEGDRTLLALPIEKAPPRLTVDFNPRPAAADKPFALRWRIAGPAGKNRVGILVRASADGGQTWVGIPAPLKGSTMTITPSQLPAGENCVLEVYASRGFRTAHYRSKPFRILRPAPAPVILSPKSPIRVRSGDPVKFVGAPASGRKRGLGALIWSSNIDGKLGTGNRIVTRDLSLGEHTIELRADVFPDRVARVSVTVAEGAAKNKARRRR